MLIFFFPLFPRFFVFVFFFFSIHTDRYHEIIASNSEEYKCFESKIFQNNKFLQKIHKYRQKTERRVSEVSSDTYGESSTRQSSLNESSSASDDHHRKQSVSTDFSSETSIELATLGYDDGSATTAECISNNASTNTRRRMIKITSNPGYQVGALF